MEYNWRLFFTKIVNSNYKAQFVNTISEGSVKVCIHCIVLVEMYILLLLVFILAVI